MTIPSVPRTLWTERAGIVAVAAEVNRLGLIWREQPSPDVGIDGQIELVDDGGRATGRIVAVQVKSGDSYLKDDGNEWLFHPDVKHRFYWEGFPLPVLLMLHSPGEGLTYWVDARQPLRGAARGEAKPIRVPKSNVLQTAIAAELFYTAGGTLQPFLALPDVLRELCRTSTRSSTFPLTYFDLFANGLTNLGTAVYFGIDLAIEVAESKLEEVEAGLCFGSDEHDFLFGYLRFLVRQHLANVDISSCLVDWHEREIQPVTIAPLTSRGRGVVQLIWEEQRRMEREGRLEVPDGMGIAQEDFVRMVFTPSHHARIPLIAAFQELLHPSDE